jgi:hydroxymethylpyrimidine/phosphomethylpyrimidine kinase
MNLCFFILQKFKKEGKIMKKVLTIAGSDSCGGAGIQADLKTFSANGVYGMSVITAVTAQNTQGVLAVQDIDEEIIRAQIDAIFTDIEVDAVKIGMVSKISTINAISDKLQQYKPKNIVLDPVMISKSGFSLLRPESKAALIKRLIPLATIITPNIPEAEEILKEIGATINKIETMEDMEKAAKEIYKLGCKNVFLKGGHMQGEAVDVLYDGKNTIHFYAKRIHTKNTHGTGCTLSSAIASNMALGFDINKAIQNAKDYITIAIAHSLSIGQGVGPTNHFYELYKKGGILGD